MKTTCNLCPWYSWNHETKDEARRARVRHFIVCHPGRSEAEIKKYEERKQKELGALMGKAMKEIMGRVRA